MAHAISLMDSSTAPASATSARTEGRRASAHADTGSGAPGVTGGFESVAELGGWLRVAMLGVFAPEMLLDDLDDGRRTTATRL